MARAWSALREWQQVLTDPAVERALDRLGDVEAIERLDGGAVYRARSGRRYVEFRKIYTEPPEPTLGAEVSIAMQASDIMLWPLEREARDGSRATFRDPRRQDRNRADRRRATRHDDDDRNEGPGRMPADGRGAKADGHG